MSGFLGGERGRHAAGCTRSAELLPGQNCLKWLFLCVLSDNTKACSNVNYSVVLVFFVIRGCLGIF